MGVAAELEARTQLQAAEVVPQIFVPRYLRQQAHQIRDYWLQVVEVAVRDQETMAMVLVALVDHYSRPRISLLLVRREIQEIAVLTGRAAQVV